MNRIAAEPRPSGLAAAGDVRAYLMVELRGLGLDPQVQTRTAVTTVGPGRQAAGRVANVRARIAGTESEGLIVLVAHYDSVPSGPGASDDGVNVAIALEVARALRAGPAPRQPVEIVFTDGEEQGLLGAQAYVDSGVAGDPARTVVVNLEARGVSGRAVMFEMVGTELTGAVAAADPVTTSFAAAVYAVLPNVTDLSVFAAAGMRGLNYAFFGGSARYHTPDDDIAHLRPGTVQDMGESALATVRALSAEPAATAPARGSPSTHFWLAGTVLSYSGGLVRPLAAAALVAYLSLLLVGRRNGLWLRGVLRAALSFTVVPVAATATGLAGWWLLTRIRPDLLVAIADVPHPWPYALAESVVLIPVLLGWSRWCRRRASADEVAAAALGWFTLLALLAAWWLPGGAYLATWPALLGAVALLLGLRPGRSWSGTVCRAVPAVAALALIGPVVLLLLPALGLALSSVPLVFAALVGALLVSLVEIAAPRRRFLLGLVALGCVAALVAGVGLVTDRYSADSPRPVSLGYVWEADGPTATWASVGGPNQPLVGPLVDGPEISLGERVPSLGPAVLSTGPAPVADLQQPRLLDRSSSVRDGVRTVRFRLVAPRDAYAIELFAQPGDGEVLGASIAGAPVAGGSSTRASDWPWSVRYVAPPADGVAVTLRVRGTAPLRLRTVSTASGLPAGVGAPVLPPEISWIGWPALSGQTLVVTTEQL